MMIYRFSDPEYEFSDGVLQGFNSETFGSREYETERAKRLYIELEVDPEDTEYVLGVVNDGRWALVGLTVSGYQFAIEDDLSTLYAQWRQASVAMMESGMGGSLDCGEQIVREDFSAFAGLSETVSYETMLALERQN